MPCFAFLVSLFLLVVIVVGLVVGLGFGTVAFVRLFRGWPGKRGVKGLTAGFLAGLGILFLSILILGSTRRLAAWLLPGLVSDYEKFDAEEREKATLYPATDDVHRFVIAQAAYQAANGGFFDTPECLARPRACIPGYTGPPFLDAKIASLGTRGGFTWSFHPGSAPPGLSKMEKVSPSSVSSYTLLGVPVEPGEAALPIRIFNLAGPRLLGVPTEPREGARSVCGDAGGVCTFFGRQLADKGGCPASCVRWTWSSG